MQRCLDAGSRTLGDGGHATHLAMVRAVRSRGAVGRRASPSWRATAHAKNGGDQWAPPPWKSWNVASAPLSTPALTRCHHAVAAIVGTVACAASQRNVAGPSHPCYAVDASSNRPARARPRRRPLDLTLALPPPLRPRGLQGDATPVRSTSSARRRVVQGALGLATAAPRGCPTTPARPPPTISTPARPTPSHGLPRQRRAPKPCNTAPMAQQSWAQATTGSSRSPPRAWSCFGARPEASCHA